MRNRVSFSYVGEYRNDYSTYSNTIFMAYSDNDIWKRGINYTYLNDGKYSYVLHNLGTSYIVQTDDHIAYLYQNEYEHYEYIINNEYDNKKQIIEETFWDDKIKLEKIITYIKLDNITNYTYHPSFIEGFVGNNYTSYKVALNCSTNDMPIDTYVFNTNNYGLSLQNDSTKISTNIRGTHPGRAGITYNIVGIGFDEKTLQNNMYCGVEHEKLICAYVYGVNADMNSTKNANKISGSDNLYSNLKITLPGVDSSEYVNGHTSSYSFLSLNKTFRHIGTVLAKLELTYHNNNYTLYKQLQFSELVQEMMGLQDLHFYVNNYENKRTAFLEGDHINYAYVKTIPNNINGTLNMTINSGDSLLNVTYTGSSVKNNNSTEYRKYSFKNGNYYIRKQEFTNDPNVVISKFTYTTNIVPLGTLPNETTPVYNLKTTNSIINHSETIDINITPYQVFGTFDIAPEYKYQLIPNESYNIVQVSYEWTDGHSGSNIVTYNSNGLKFVNSKNSYAFEFKGLKDPGLYTFKCKLINGNIETDNRLGTFRIGQSANLSYEIIVYEGMYHQNILPVSLVSSYIVDSSSIYDLYVGNNTHIYVPNYTFNNWQNPYSYLDVHTDTTSFMNIGFLNKSNSDATISTPGSNCVKLDFNNKENDFITINEKYKITVKKVKTLLSVKLNSGEQLYRGELTGFPNNIDVNKNNSNIPYIDISTIDSDEITLDIKEIFDNFEGVENYEHYFSGAEFYPRTSSMSWDSNNGILTIDKTSFPASGDDAIVAIFTSKLNRLGAPDYNIYYWEELGFSNAIKNYSLYIYNTQQKINDIPVPTDIYLFSNVKDSLDSGQGPSTYSVQYISAQSSNVEPLTIKYNGSTWTNQSTNNTFNIEQTQNGYIKFTPTFNANGTYTLTLSNSTETITKNVNVHILPMTFEYNDEATTLNYLTDINDNVVLYEEILLVGDINGSTANDRTFISTFCNVNNVNSFDNRLDYYSIKNNGNIMIYVKNSQNTNIPNGVEFIKSSTNLDFNYNYKVLIPTSTTNVKLKYYHRCNSTDIIIEHQIDMIKDDNMNQDVKLYTHGKQYE